MSLISSGTMARLQAVALTTLDDTAQILVDTQGDDGRGGQTDSWAQVGSDIPCRLKEIKEGDERIQQGIFLTTSYWVISLPVGTSVTPKNRIQISTKANRTFEIKGIDGPKTYEALLRAYCVEVL